MYLYLYIKSREPESHSVFGGQKGGRNMELPPEVDVSTLKSNSNNYNLGVSVNLKFFVSKKER